jgi:segregation and condensation protein B
MSSEIASKIEALLFIAKKPLALKEISKFVGSTDAEVREALQQLADKYSNGGLQVLEVAGGFQLATHPDCSGVIEKFLHSPLSVTLSPAALETLAIIAYRQPVSRTDIENIRGVNSDSVVENLIEKGMIKETGRSQGVGRPIIYGTTDEFLIHFGLKSLEELPPHPQAQAAVQLSFSGQQTSSAADLANP